MHALTALAFPCVASLAGAGLALRAATRGSNRHNSWLRRLWRAAALVLGANAVASLAFALVVVQASSASGSRDPLWFLPLLFAPLEYWARFGIPIVALAILVGAALAYRRAGARQTPGAD